MAENIEYLKDFVEHVYRRLEKAIEGLTDKELIWIPIPEMNSTGKILRHTSRISLLLIPSVLEGTTSGHWTDDYEEREHSLAEMLIDMEKGKKVSLAILSEIKTEDLEKEIPLWGGLWKCKEGVYMLVGELIYHAGQIALLRGAYKRSHRDQCKS